MVCFPTIDDKFLVLILIFTIVFYLGMVVTLVLVILGKFESTLYYEIHRKFCVLTILGLALATAASQVWHIGLVALFPIFFTALVISGLVIHCLLAPATLQYRVKNKINDPIDFLLMLSSLIIFVVFNVGLIYEKFFELMNIIFNVIYLLIRIFTYF